MSTRHTTLDDLMHRVLEGDATPAEQYALEARLAADPTARARFDAQADLLQRLSETRLAEVPADLHDAVMAEVRRSPLPGHSTVVHGGPLTVAPSGRTGFDRRWAFPAAALAVALVMLWFTAVRKPPGAPGGTAVSGAMALAGADGTFNLGEGDAVLIVRWERVPGGFVLRVRTAGQRAEAELTALTPGARLQIDALAGRAQAGRGIQLSLPAHQEGAIRGHSLAPVAVVRIQVRFADGHTVVREIKITGLQDAAPESDDPNGPTSVPPPGH